MQEIPHYPDSCSLALDFRNLLHERLSKLPQGISEFSYANLYLFREQHNYRLSSISGDLVVILGRDDNSPFFMLPFGLPEKPTLNILFNDHRFMKCVTEEQKAVLESMGFRTIEDRDNFDYLYKREDLAELKGRKFHKKRNLIKAFISSHEYTAKPLLDEHLPAALEILDKWREHHGSSADYISAKEALEQSWDLQLCGGIYFVDDEPVAYSLGEELANSTSFVIHFEKALPGYKGLYQFINKTFAAILPDFYTTINREQDLGDKGLRQAKHSYKPVGYVKKYLAFR